MRKSARLCLKGYYLIIIVLIMVYSGAQRDIIQNEHLIENSVSLKSLGTSYRFSNQEPSKGQYENFPPYWTLDARILSEDLSLWYHQNVNAQNIFVYNGFAFVAADENGLVIINITDITNPGVPLYRSSLGRVYDVYVKDGYAYLAEGSIGLTVWDVRSPTEPSRIGSYSWSAASETDRIFVWDNYAFLADDTEGVQIVNIAQPANPIPIGPPIEGIGSWDVFVENNYLFTADYDQGIAITNITDLANPGPPIFLNITGYSLDIFVKENYAYIAAHSGGLAVVNVTDPSLPEVLTYHNFNYTYDVFIDSNNLYVTNREAGDFRLSTIDISDPLDFKNIKHTDLFDDSGGGIFVDRKHLFFAYVHGLDVINVTDFYDLTPPIISVHNPTNSTYFGDNVLLSFSASEELAWKGYSLDNCQNVSVPENIIMLTNLASGPHSLEVFGNDSWGNMGKSGKIEFSMNNDPFVVEEVILRDDFETLDDWLLTIPSVFTHNLSYGNEAPSVEINSTLEEIGLCTQDLFLPSLNESTFLRISIDIFIPHLQSGSISLFTGITPFDFPFQVRIYDTNSISLYMYEDSIYKIMQYNFKPETWYTITVDSFIDHFTLRINNYHLFTLFSSGYRSLTVPIAFGDGDDSISEQGHYLFDNIEILKIQREDAFTTTKPQLLIYGSYPGSSWLFENETKTLLEDIGFDVKLEDKGTIPVLTSSVLCNVSQLWLINSLDGFDLSTEEINVILEAWRGGMALVLAGDQEGFYTNVNLVGQCFGVEFEGAYTLTEPQTPIFEPHPIWTDVTSIWADKALPQLVISGESSAQALSTVLGYIQHVILENDTGIVFWDSSYGHLIDEHLTKNDNLNYVSNLVKYLQAPEIAIIGAANGSIITTSSQLSLEVVDDNLMNITYNWDQSSNQTHTNQELLPLPESEGWHNLSVYATDIWNHASTSNYTYYLNFYPNITLLTPANESWHYSSFSIQFKMTDETLEKVWYQWDSNPPQTLNYPWIIECDESDEIQYYYVSANDSYGFTTLIKLVFYLNKEPPKITLIQPSNNTTITPTDIILDITSFTLEKAWYNWNNDANRTLSIPWLISCPSSEAYYILIVAANDSIGRVTQKRFVWNIDLPPKIVLTSHENESILSETSILEFNINDSSLQIVWYYWNDNPPNYLDQLFHIPSNTIEGWQCLKLFANDSIGSITSQEYIFYCDITFPTISLSSNLKNGSMITPFTSLYLNISDSTLNQVEYKWDDQPYIVIFHPWLIPLPSIETWETLIIKAIDEVNHTSLKSFELYLNLPPQISLLSPLCNNSILAPNSTVQIDIFDPSLSKVWYIWNLEMREEIIYPFIIPTIGEGNQTLTIICNDSWGVITNTSYYFYVHTFLNIDINESLPQIAYEGKKFVVSLIFTNTETIPLIITFFAYGIDDKIVTDNGISIFLNPNDNYTFKLEIIPKHASIHLITLEFYWGTILYGQYQMQFTVQPFWMSPSFFLPFILFPSIIILIIILAIVSSIQISKMRKQVAKAIKTSFEVSESISLNAIQKKAQVPSILVMMELKNHKELIKTESNLIIHQQKVIDQLGQVLSRIPPPHDLRIVSKHFQLQYSDFIPLMKAYIQKSGEKGILHPPMYFPRQFLDVISTKIIDQKSGIITEFQQEHRIPDLIFDTIVKEIDKNIRRIHTSYISKEQNIFAIIDQADWNRITSSIDSEKGFQGKSVGINFTPSQWELLFLTQNIPVILYNGSFYSIEGLRIYTLNHLDEISEIIRLLRRQLSIHSLSQQKRTKILHDFEQLLPVEPILLPFYCQLDNAMVTKADTVFVCCKCNRNICGSCYEEMSSMGMNTCIHCGGELKKHPTLQLEFNLQLIDQMTAHEFELFIEGLFKSQGYHMQYLQRDTPNWVTIIVERGKNKIGVQVNQSKPPQELGKEVIKDLKDDPRLSECTKFRYVTTALFTSGAREYAETIGMELWDRETLKKYLDNYRNHIQK